MQLNGLFKYGIMIFIIMFALPVCAADDNGLEVPEQSINMNRRGNNRIEVPIGVKVCMVCCVGGCCGCLAKSMANQSLAKTPYESLRSFELGFFFGAQCTKELLENPAVVQKVNEIGTVVAHHVHRLLHDKTD